MFMEGLRIAAETPIRMNGVPDEIRTEHLPNSALSLDR
jgi:hypothetical protein